MRWPLWICLPIACGCGAELDPERRAPPAPAALRQPAAVPASAPTAEVLAEQDPDTASSHAAPTQPSAVPDGMLFVAPGTFRMGSDDEGEHDERPAHAVTVPAFLLDRTEVTNAAYLECVKAGVCKPYDSLRHSRLTRGRPEAFHLPEHPVVGVSWFDAKQYCAWRGRRLPREAEWERAARGDDDRRYVWGNEPPDPTRHGVFGGQPSTAKVGSFPGGRGAYGHLDLAGNVWEWQEDEYDPYAYRRPGAERGIPGSCDQILATQDELRRQGKQGFTGKNPIPVECERVLRGGAYNYGAGGLRNSNRVHHPPSWRLAVAGFRCAGDVELQR